MSDTNSTTNIQKRPKMNEVFSDAKALEELLIDLEGDLTEQEAVYAELNQQILEERDESINRCLWVVKRLEQRAENLKTDANEILAMSKKAQKEADNLKAFVLKNCIANGWDKFKTQNFNVSVASAGGAQSIRYFDQTGLETTNLENLPTHLRTEIVSYKANTEQIREEFKAQDTDQLIYHDGDKKMIVQLLPRGKYLKF